MSVKWEVTKIYGHDYCDTEFGTYQLRQVKSTSAPTWRAFLDGKATGLMSTDKEAVKAMVEIAVLAKRNQPL